MSNDCTGTLRVVAKDKMTLERLKNIMNYEDDEYCLFRCKGCNVESDIEEVDGFFTQDFDVDGAWNCSQFFEYGDRPNEHLKSYGKKEDGTTDFDVTIEKSAHFTDLTHLAKVLDFGCELFSYEPGCEFSEHCGVDHNGECYLEREKYTCTYPEDENGEPDYDEEPEEDFGFVGYMDFNDYEDIYDSLS